MSRHNEARDQAAAQWFARMRGPDADRHREAFMVWREDAANRRAYDEIAEQFDMAAILAQSRRPELLRRTRQARDLGSIYKITGALAACVIAAAVLSMIVWRGGQAETRYATGLGQIRSVMLADGSSMVLDTDSVATATMRGGRQVVRLNQGRARIVATKNLRIEADRAQLDGEGATIDLALAPQGTLAVTVLSGQPRLSGAAAKLLPASTTLPAGREVLFGPKLSSVNIRLASRVEAQWPSGLRTFDQTPLSEVAAIANRYNSRKIRLADASIGALRVSGAFRVTGASELANGLAAAFGLTVLKAPNGDLILSRAAA
uniref:FecR family protein n=1 Tax=uncultured Caulobacter sp. TaxID=158749 RepID=UPI0025F733BA|nr:FecR domain-containing protein [uncultured Caulobacter sp.]